MIRQYSLKSARLMQLPKCVEDLSRAIKHDEIQVKSGYTRKQSASWVDAIKEVTDRDLPLEIVFVRPTGNASIELSGPWTILELRVVGFDDQKALELYQIIERDLELKLATDADRRGVATLGNIMDVLWKVYDRLVDVANNLTPPPEDGVRKRCFVSFRFDDHSKALALELKEFLELAGMAFVSGLGYEPRSISEKVLDRLSERLDLFMVIFSVSGDSAWLNQEIGVARARKLPILVLKEEGFDADLGMLRDTEYLAFPRNQISRAFVGILQALTYLDKKAAPALEPEVEQSFTPTTKP